MTRSEPPFFANFPCSKCTKQIFEQDWCRFSLWKCGSQMAEGRRRPAEAAMVPRSNQYGNPCYPYICVPLTAVAKEALLLYYYYGQFRHKSGDGERGLAHRCCTILSLYWIIWYASKKGPFLDRGQARRVSRRDSLFVHSGKLSLVSKPPVAYSLKRRRITKDGCGSNRIRKLQQYLV